MVLARGEKVIEGKWKWLKGSLIIEFLTKLK